jgi:hypothetical protein
MYSGEYDAYFECISTPGKSEKYACIGRGIQRSYRFGFPPWPGIFFRLARCGYTLMQSNITSIRHDSVGKALKTAS